MQNASYSELIQVLDRFQSQLIELDTQYRANQYRITGMLAAIANYRAGGINPRYNPAHTDADRAAWSEGYDEVYNSLGMAPGITNQLDNLI